MYCRVAATGPDPTGSSATIVWLVAKSGMNKVTASHDQLLKLTVK